MAFADPQSVTINGVATSLPRTGSSSNAGTFLSADGLVKESISHTNSGKRIRSVVRLDQSLSVTDPIIPAQNVVTKQAVYLVVDRPVVGLTIAQQKYLVDALVAYLSASSGAKVTQLLGTEN